MESKPSVLRTLLLTSSSVNLVCVVTLLTLCAPPLSTLSTAPTLDTSLTASIQPSFTTTPDPGASSLTSSHNNFQDVSLASVLPSSRLHSSVALAESNQLESIITSSTGLSNHLSSSHVELLSTYVTQKQTVTRVLPTTLLSEPTYTTLSSSVIASTTTLGGFSSDDIGGMNTSTSPGSSERTTVSSNETLPKSTLDGTGVVTSTTLSPPFGNGSCSGNNTGCPEYNGKQDLALSTPAIVGIAVGAAVLVIIVVCLVLCMCRRRRTLSGSKADLSTYWDDNVTLSYINGHLDYPKDVSDEMVSLDNDSFLNSLDSMSFSNMWATENAKHTNF